MNKQMKTKEQKNHKKKQKNLTATQPSRIVSSMILINSGAMVIVCVSYTEGDTACPEYADARENARVACVISSWAHLRASVTKVAGAPMASNF